jgi:hypothetical protein
MAGGCTAVSNCSNQRAHRRGGLRRRSGGAGASAGVGGLGGPPGAQLALARGSGGAGAWWSAVAAAMQGLGAAELRERAELGLRAAAVRRDGGKGSAGALLIGRRPTWACVPGWKAGEIPGGSRGRALREEGDGTDRRARAAVRGKATRGWALASGAMLQRGRSVRGGRRRAGRVAGLGAWALGWAERTGPRGKPGCEAGPRVWAGLGFFLIFLSIFYLLSQFKT